MKKMLQKINKIIIDSSKLNGNYSVYKRNIANLNQIKGK